jgi:hypothetical protein
MSISKTEALKRLEGIYEFFNRVYDKDYITIHKEDMIIVFDYALTEFRQVLNEMMEVNDEQKA